MTPHDSADAPPPLATRIRSVDRSGIRVMFDAAAELERSDLVHLEIGEPDFDTPAHVVDAAADAARDGRTHYTANAGRLDLREAIAADVGSESTGASNDPAVDPEREVVVTAGAMEALHLSMLAIVDPGDDVVIPTPAWPNYETQVRLAGGVPVPAALPASEGFALDAARVTDAMSEATAAVVLTTPSNPTGRVFDRDAVAQVVRAASRHDAYVVVDEVYRDLVYEGASPSVLAAADAPANVVAIGSCSKTYAMTGWRLGWAVGPARVVDAMTTLHESTSACASSVSQAAALAALTGPREAPARMRAAFRERREYVLDRVADLPSVSCPTPEGAFYAFLDVGDLDGDSFDVADRLLHQHGVVTAPGAAFGDAGEGYLRVSFATDLGRLETGLDRIERMVRAEGTR